MTRWAGYGGIIFIFAASLSSVPSLPAYEVTLHGGPRMDIPTAWLLDDSDPTIPTWYSQDRRGGAEVRLWAPGTWATLDEFIGEWMPEGAEGDIVRFSHWGGEAMLADWTFELEGVGFRGWFLFTKGTGPEVRVSAIAAEEDYPDIGHFLLSIIDGYSPSDRWRRTPGAIGRFLELSGEPGTETIVTDFGGETLRWVSSPAGNVALQDLIEREALILASYAMEPDLFYEAWSRYYRLIFRDSYTHLTSLSEALKNGPLPPGESDERETAEAILAWLQSFSYGSTDGFSDLLAPPVACASGAGDCDSLALALLILMDSYGVEGRILISHQAAHAVAALDLPGEGLRYVEGERSWLVAELTTELPLGALPPRLDGVNDWFGIDLLEE